MNRTRNPALTVMSPVISALIWLIAWTLPAGERREIQRKGEDS